MAGKGGTDSEASTGSTVEALSQAATLKLLHELRVHQIELEMQNEELQRASAEAEAAREHLAMLFDFAPLAYFRLDAAGAIRELNLAGAQLLGVNRVAAVGAAFARFLDDDGRAEFGEFVRASFGSEGSHQTLTTSLRGVAESPVPVQLTCTRVAGEPHLLVAAVDLTDHLRVTSLARERTLADEAIAGLRAIATRKATEDPTDLFEDILETAMAISGAQGGTLHLCDRSPGVCEIIAHRGLHPSYVDNLSSGGRGCSYVTGAAWSRRSRVVVEDVASPPSFLDASDVAAIRAVGMHASQATPLLDRSGVALGVLTTHFASPTRASEQGHPVIDVLARLCADVIAQRQLLSDVREAEGLHRQFLGTIADPVVIVDPTGSIVYANGQAERAFGYLPGELAGVRYEALLPERVRDAYQEQWIEFAGAPPAQVIVGTAARPLDARRKDGSEFPIEVTLNPFTTSSGLMVSTVVRDISERRRLEAAAERHSERLAGAIETIPDVIAIWDADDHLVACNEAFRSLFADQPLEAWVGCSVDEVLARPTPFLDAQDAAVWFGADVTERPTVFDIVLRDGRRFRASSRKKVHGGRVTTGVDLTEDLVRERELELAREKAEAASRAKDEFLASMSHELRTPLNAVLGFCQLLQRDRKEQLTERQREMVDQVAKGGEHLLALIDDVLDLARIESNRVSIVSEAVSVRDTVSEVLDTLSPLADRSGVELRFDAADACEAVVDADPRRFLQILLNLTSNAIKYNNRGGTVTFIVSRANAAVIRVTVVDTGRGIAVHEQFKLFTAFNRAGQEGGSIEGTGIGLVISRRLAELMGGGRVGFVSRVGVGSSFWVELPAHVAAAIESKGGLRASAAGAPCEGLIVYVDDSQASLAFLRMVVEQLGGVEIVTAATASEGIALVRGRRPDLVLMDINLPDMSGFEALAILHADPATRDIPVMALSAAASAEARARGLRAGFQRYLTKPVRVDELEDVIREVLTRTA